MRTIGTWLVILCAVCNGKSWKAPNTAMKGLYDCKRCALPSINCLMYSLKRYNSVLH